MSPVRSAHRRKFAPWFALTFFALTSRVEIASAAPVDLEVVAEFGHEQVTGVAVSKKGRIFVNFPDWSLPRRFSVAEIDRDKQLKPYPTAEWNQGDGNPEKRFVCVQSVFVDDDDNLWILDPGSPKMAGVLAGAPKLLKVDLSTDKVVEQIRFPDLVTTPDSYLNDDRIDPAKQYAIRTDSAAGGLVVVNLHTKQSRRVLAANPSTQAEPNLILRVEGIPLINSATDKPLQGKSDGIAYDREEGYIYYQALSGRTLYRVPIKDLEDESLSEDDLGSKIETVATVPAADGIAYHHGSIFLTGIEENAVNRLDLKTRRVERLVQDGRLKWPDSLSFGPENDLYVTSSQIHLTATFHQGQSKVTEPFRLFRFKVAAD